MIGLLAAEDLLGLAILASADATIVARCAAAAPAVPRSVLFRPVDVDPIELARVARADFIHPCWEAELQPDKLLGGRWLDRVRRHGLGVICWHEERPDVLAELLALGVDGICTDDPALLAELAERHRDRRDIWPATDRYARSSACEDVCRSLRRPLDIRQAPRLLVRFRYT